MKTVVFTSATDSWETVHLYFRQENHLVLYNSQNRKAIKKTIEHCDYNLSYRPPVAEPSLLVSVFSLEEKGNGRENSVPWSGGQPAIMQRRSRPHLRINGHRARQLPCSSPLMNTKDYFSALSHVLSSSKCRCIYNLGFSLSLLFFFVIRLL